MNVIKDTLRLHNRIKSDTEDSGATAKIDKAGVGTSARGLAETSDKFGIGGCIGGEKEPTERTDVVSPSSRIGNWKDRTVGRHPRTIPARITNNFLRCSTAEAIKSKDNSPGRIDAKSIATDSNAPSAVGLSCSSGHCARVASLCTSCIGPRTYNRPPSCRCFSPCVRKGWSFRSHHLYKDPECGPKP